MSQLIKTTDVQPHGELNMPRREAAGGTGSPPMGDGGVGNAQGGINGTFKWG